MTETPSTIGAYLKAARETRRIGIERAAEETKIRSEYLAHIESDRLDFLAPAYVRGFIKTYAGFLRVDAGPLLDEFDRVTFSPAGQAIASGQASRPSRVPLWVWTALATTAGVGVLVLALMRLIEGAG